jgi:hypothetical protein
MSEKKKWVYPEYTEVGTPENKRELSPEEAIKKEQLERAEKEAKAREEERRRKEEQFRKQESEGFRQRILDAQLESEKTMMPKRVLELLEEAKELNEELRNLNNLRMYSGMQQDKERITKRLQEINTEIFSGKYSMKLPSVQLEKVEHYRAKTQYGEINILNNTISGVLDSLPGYGWQTIRDQTGRPVKLKGIIPSLLLRSEFWGEIDLIYPAEPVKQEPIKEKPVENKEKTSKFSLSNIFKKKEERKENTPAKGTIDYDMQQIECPKCRIKLPRSSFKYSRMCPNCGNPYSWE